MITRKMKLLSPMVMILALIASAAESKSKTTKSPVTYLGEIKSHGHKTALIYLSVDLKNAIPLNTATFKDKLTSCPDTRNPVHTNTVQKWGNLYDAYLPDYGIKEKTSVVINTNFYSWPSKEHISSATCAEPMGAMTIGNFGYAPAVPYSNILDCKCMIPGCKGITECMNDDKSLDYCSAHKPECIPLDALFIYNDGSNLVALIEPAELVKETYEGLEGGGMRAVLSLQAGYILISNGVIADLETGPATHHSQERMAARMAIGYDSKDFSKIYIFYAPTGHWNGNKSQAGGLTALGFAESIKGIDGIDVDNVIMLDGGGSAQLNARNVANWPDDINTNLPYCEDNCRPHRPVPSALGFVYGQYPPR